MTVCKLPLGPVPLALGQLELAVMARPIPPWQFAIKFGGFTVFYFNQFSISAAGVFCCLLKRRFKKTTQMIVNHKLLVSRWVRDL